MSIFDDKSLKSVAEAVMQVMQQEELKGNQHKIDANKNGKVDAHDFKLLRAKKDMKEEESKGASKNKEEKFHMGLDKLVHKTFGKSPAEMKEGMGSDSKASQYHQSIRSKNPKLPKNPNYYKEMGATYDIEDDAKRSTAQSELKKKHGMKEETEQLQEYESKSGVYRNKGTYGGSKGTEYGNTDWDKEESDSKKMPEKPKASRKLGARQNFVRARRVNESFTQMIESYQENGLKSLANMVSFDEEVDNETYEKEMKDQKMKFDGKKKGANVAKASVQAVKVEEATHTEIQVIDMTDADNIKKEIIDIAELEERTLTEPETKKKEEIVKSMKKNMQGFRDRYGDKGKSVAYATATKIAKEKA